MLMNSTWASDTQGRECLSNALRAGDEAYKDMLSDMYADAGWLAPEILQDMRDSDDFYCSLFAQTRSPKLQDRRVVLLGDAGHAMPGIGTSLAITGAYIFAGEILRARSDVVAAMERYEGLMLPFVKKQQSGDDDFAMQLANPQTWWGIMIRNLVLRIVIGSGLMNLGMRVSAWLGYSEAKVDIPEYPWPTEKEK